MMVQQLPDVQPQTTKLPIDYKPAMLEPQFKSDIDAGFNADEIQKLISHGLYTPSDVLKASINGTMDGLYTPSDVLKASINGTINVDEYDEDIGKKLNKIGAKKGN